MEHDMDEEKTVECIGCQKDSGLTRCKVCEYYFCADCEKKMADCK